MITKKATVHKLDGKPYHVSASVEVGAVSVDVSMFPDLSKIHPDVCAVRVQKITEAINTLLTVCRSMEGEG